MKPASELTDKQPSIRRRTNHLRIIMTKKQRRKLEALVRKWKGAAKSNQSASKSTDYYCGRAVVFAACAHYLQQFLEGK